MISPTLLGAAVEGVGLAQLPAPMVAERLGSGQLEVVLADFAPMAPGLFLYYPDRRQVMPKLRAFIDHVKSRHAAGAGGGRRDLPLMRSGPRPI